MIRGGRWRPREGRCPSRSIGWPSGREPVPPWPALPAADCLAPPDSPAPPGRSVRPAEPHFC
eukprot:3690274-Heterocapsa_arctica.AAC.1